MIIQLQLLTFDLKSIKELLFNISLNELKSNFCANGLVIYPIKKIKRTILRAPNGDKKTGQESLKLFTYTLSLQIAIYNLKALFWLSNFLIRNFYKININFIKIAKNNQNY